MHCATHPSRAIPLPGRNVLSDQIAMLFILALPVASVAWTVTHEEIFREPREWCEQKCQTAQHPVVRKCLYLFTCEYCFSHYVSFVVLVVTGYRLGYTGWRGFGVALFALVWIANVYMSLYSRLRLDIKHEHVDIAAAQEQAQATTPIDKGQG